MITSWCHLHLLWQRLFLPSWYGRGGYLRKGNVYSAFRQTGREGRELFLCLLFVNCFPFKIILMPQWHIWGGPFKLPSVSSSRYKPSCLNKLEISFPHIQSWTVLAAPRPLGKQTPCTSLLCRPQHLASTSSFMFLELLPWHPHSNQQGEGKYERWGGSGGR